ncbi:ABC transporter ATP-binding protein [Pedobacter riviphilus]|uniref:ABC transporter ATP-binding protein n=1 Tax=Pedobacter riviphilus TaxID=2766984 RepID=A0ABX6TCR5_9SPHI|nr:MULTISPECIES: ATP-binding cassette domain-containing protein [Pedobacter]NII85320.1 ABC-2 type transport system ATP-binding protein [Pedobacter sp. SG908]NMN39765.1 ABC-2 type transport system ATP-binding protein [Pedobacter sp. SG918]QNR83268.1 ABC transporter ATP-binding protein [Pedobacter riviphilus]
MLHFNQFEKSYFNHLILKIDNIKIPEGIFWIKGSNGAGKSTLLKAIAGILSFKGDIAIGTVYLKDHGVSYRKLVNFAEAEPLYPEFLTGFEMVDLFAKAKGAISSQGETLITDMGMKPYIHNPVGSYSSGMLKKLSLVLAFLGQPRLILLDEPLNTIDVESLEILYRWINEKYQNEKISFLLSSHQSLDEAKLPGLKQINIDDKKITLNF